MRTELRNIELSDANFLYELHKDKEYMKYFGTPWDSLIETQEKIIHSLQCINNGTEVFQIILNIHTKEKLGFIRVYVNEKNEYLVDFASSKKHQGQGYITESLEQILKILEYNKIPLIYANVNSLNNFGALKILYNLGFQDFLPIITGIEEVENGTLDEPSLGLTLLKPIIKDFKEPSKKSISESNKYFEQADKAEQIGDYEKRIEII